MMIPHRSDPLAWKSARCETKPAYYGIANIEHHVGLGPIEERVVSAVVPMKADGSRDYSKEIGLVRAPVIALVVERAESGILTSHAEVLLTEEQSQELAAALLAAWHREAT
jgi:hypothetical protein